MVRGCTSPGPARLRATRPSALRGARNACGRSPLSPSRSSAQERDVERRPPPPLQEAVRLVPRYATSESALEVVLPERQDRRDDQIPDARDDEQLDDVVGS